MLKTGLKLGCAAACALLIFAVRSAASEPGVSIDWNADPMAGFRKEMASRGRRFKDPKNVKLVKWGKDRVDQTRRKARSVGQLSGRAVDIRHNSSHKSSRLAPYRSPELDAFPDLRIPRNRYRPPSYSLPDVYYRPPVYRYRPPDYRYHPPDYRYRPPDYRYRPPGSRYRPPGSRYRPPGYILRPPGLRR